MSFWRKNSSSNGAYEKALSLLGEGSETRGEFHTPGNLRIEGTYHGNLRVEGRLVLAPSAEVTGTIHAGQVHVAGHFTGEIIADDIVEIAPTACIQGEIRARHLECQKGAKLEVRCWTGEEALRKPESVPPLPNKNRRS
ncbi:MAG: polymer-forming cytoskeletal protein [Bacteroidia bacterium]|nr:polymer-forming cytoskeletal protein [Bacteroidia bacterium]MCX7652942.1 polymer-forming cytoskeletal protein [Bacteroidia bacterium]MDW8416590.1 polymer-forming cytoskeletal protein [Bacteroidia bacterium]